MFSRKSILSTFIINVILVTCLSYGAALAEETSVQTKPARSVNTPQNTVPESDRSASGLGLITEQKKIVTEIREIKTALENERENYRKTTGEEHLLAWTEVSKNLLSLSDALDLLIQNYSEQKEKGLDISEISMLIKDFVLAESGYIRGDISEIHDIFFDLREKTKDIKIENIFKYQRALEKQQNSYQKLLFALLANIERKQKVGLGASDDNRYIDLLVKELAEKSRARLLMAKEKLGIVESQITNAPEEEKSGFRTQRQLIEVNKKMASRALAKTIDLMNARGLETAEYSEFLITATGEISKEIFDTEVATGLLEQWSGNAWKFLKERAPDLVFKGIILLLIVIVFKVMASFAGNLVGKAVSQSRLSLSKLLQDFFVSVSKKAVWIVGILIVLSQLGIQIGPLLAGLGLVGFIVGFALQDTLSNFASGLMILIYKPFDVEDLIEVGGISGKVKHMTLVSTTILTPDNQRLILPNNKIWGDIIKNITAENRRRIDMVFGIGYEDNIAHAEKALKDIIHNEKDVLRSPEPVIRIGNLGDSSVDIFVRPWVKTKDYWEVRWRITRAVKERFDAEGISIPFPQRDIHIVDKPSPS